MGVLLPSLCCPIHARARVNCFDLLGGFLHIAPGFPLGPVHARLSKPITDTGRHDRPILRVRNATADDHAEFEPAGEPLALGLHRRGSGLTGGRVRDYGRAAEPRAVGGITTVFVEIKLSGQSDEILDAFRKVRWPGAGRAGNPTPVGGERRLLLKVVARDSEGISPASTARPRPAAGVWPNANPALREDRVQDDGLAGFFVEAARGHAVKNPTLFNLLPATNSFHVRFMILFRQKRQRVAYTAMKQAETEVLWRARGGGLRHIFGAGRLGSEKPNKWLKWFIWTVKPLDTVAHAPQASIRFGHTRRYGVTLAKRRQGGHDHSRQFEAAMHFGCLRPNARTRGRAPPARTCGAPMSGSATYADCVAVRWGATPTICGLGAIGASATCVPRRSPTKVAGAP